MSVMTPSPPKSQRLPVPPLVAPTSSPIKTPSGDTAEFGPGVLLFNVSWDDYEKILEGLDGHRIRVTYDRGTLEIMPIGAGSEDPPGVLLDGVSWKAYEIILEALEGRHIRVTYDQGSLELMPLSTEHEAARSLYGLLLSLLARAMGIRIKSFGSTTCKQNVERGLEPDLSFYFRNWERMRDVDRLDLTIHPPPDLAIEVDVTSSSLDRMTVYAALGVPELWRQIDNQIHIYQLDADGKYVEIDNSPTFPGFPADQLPRFIKIGRSGDDTEMMNAFEAWLKRDVLKRE